MLSGTLIQSQWDSAVQTAQRHSLDMRLWLIDWEFEGQETSRQTKKAMN